MNEADDIRVRAWIDFARTKFLVFVSQKSLDRVSENFRSPAGRMKPRFQVARRDFRSPGVTGLPHFATPGVCMLKMLTLYVCYSSEILSHSSTWK